MSQIGRDGLILVEENLSQENEIELVQGICLLDNPRDRPQRSR